MTDTPPLFPRSRADTCHLPEKERHAAMAAPIRLLSCLFFRLLCGPYIALLNSKYFDERFFAEDATNKQLCVIYESKALL